MNKTARHVINKDEKTLTLADEQGNTQTFDVLFQFSTPETDKEYIVFTDYTPDEKGGTSLSAASFEKDNLDSLAPIEKEEWDMIYHVLEQFQKELSD